MSIIEKRLITFGTKTIEAALGELDDIIHPAEGFVSWYNDTDEYISVKTYDEKDAVRWIAYKTRRIAPKQAVQLTARGEYIHIYVGENQATYDCKKGHSYLFDGTRVHAKTS